MFTGKVLRQALDKFMKGEVAANARVQVIYRMVSFMTLRV